MCLVRTVFASIPLSVETKQGLIAHLAHAIPGQNPEIAVMGELKRYRFSPNAPLLSSMDTYLGLLSHIYPPSNNGELHDLVSVVFYTGEE